MTFEVDFKNMLVAALAGPDVYWDTTPETYRVGDNGVVILQQVGGKAYQFVEKDGGAPSHKHARVQATSWCKSRFQAAPLARQIEDVINASPFVSEPIGAPTGVTEEGLGLFGSQQQFGVWFADP